ncbi:hypothetical protein N2152v2_001072 [Parachlorella kessleri]
METDDELDLEGAGMSPLSLEDEEPSAKRAAASWSDPDKGTSGSSPPSKEESAGGSPAWERRSPRFNDYYKDDSDTAEATSDAEHAQEEEKKRRFKELRKKHYNMREALKKVKEQGTQEEAEEDAGAEADVEDAGEASGQGEDEVEGLGTAAAAPVANGHAVHVEQLLQPEQARQQAAQGLGEGRAAGEDES